MDAKIVSDRLKYLSSKITIFKLDDYILEDIYNRLGEIDVLINKNRKFNSSVKKQVVRITENSIYGKGMKISDITSRMICEEQGFPIDKNYKPSCYMSNHCHNVSCFCYPECVIDNENSWFNKKK